MELNDEEEWVPNSFVKLMMSVIDEAARYMYMYYRLTTKFKCAFMKLFGNLDTCSV